MLEHKPTLWFQNCRNASLRPISSIDCRLKTALKQQHPSSWSRSNKFYEHLIRHFIEVKLLKLLIVSPGQHDFVVREEPLLQNIATK
jgi:hypothetical protein